LTRDPRTASDSTVAIVESDPRLADRVTRILATAARFRRTICVRTVGELRGQSGEDTRIIACGGRIVSELVSSLDERARNVSLVVWTSAADRDLFALATQLPRLTSLIAWPENHEAPRLWELALPVRRLVVGEEIPLQVRDFLLWEGARQEWLPRCTADLHATLDEVQSRLDLLTVPKRTARRIIGVAHELLMNAMYDAPVDDYGRPLYAHDRTQNVSLDPRDAPRFVLATDGMTVVIQVVDRFGGLYRQHVYGSIQRGLRSRDADASRDEIINTSNGGAGLGIHRIVFQANATVFEVIPQRVTVATVLFDLDQANREARTSPRSLHVFRRGEPEGLANAG
jgi:hypothetical protein